MTPHYLTTVYKNVTDDEAQALGNHPKMVAISWRHALADSDDESKNYHTAQEVTLRDHFAGKVKLAPVNPEPMPVPAELPDVDIGEHSLTIDQILCETIRDGLRKPLPDGLKLEAAYFARCHGTVDYKIGMTNFIVNGPRVPAAFMHE